MAAILAVCPSGQREQTVNLPAQPTQVRTLAPPREWNPRSSAEAQWAGVSSYTRAPGPAYAAAGSVTVRWYVVSTQKPWVSAAWISRTN